MAPVFFVMLVIHKVPKRSCICGLRQNWLVYVIDIAVCSMCTSRQRCDCRYTADVRMIWPST